MVKPRHAGATYLPYDTGQIVGERLAMRCGRGDGLGLDDRLPGIGLKGLRAIY